MLSGRDTIGAVGNAFVPTAFTAAEGRRFAFTLSNTKTADSPSSAWPSVWQPLSETAATKTDYAIGLGRITGHMRRCRKFARSFLMTDPNGPDYDIA